MYVLVLSPGVEPGAPVPQTEILSIKLREQMAKIVPHGVGIVTAKIRPPRFLNKSPLAQSKNLKILATCGKMVLQ